MKRFVWIGCFAVICAMGLMPLPCALAEIPATERVPITDPAALEFIGFPANAENVFLRTGVTTGDPPLEPNDFGSGRLHYTILGAKEFIGRENTTGSAWAWNGGEVGCCSNLSRVGTEQFADAVIHLPTGARLELVRWWAHDVDATNDMGFFLFEACSAGNTAGPMSATQITSGSTSGSTGYQSGGLVFDPLTIDNENCHYNVRVRFSGTTQMTFQKIRFEWNRQISPAPATATFANDVPTTHLFFRFIEALAAAGVTGGCGAGSYCPDTPVTRGQMAVFLSGALGLFWP